MAADAATDRHAARADPTAPPVDPPHAVVRLLVWGIGAAGVALVHNRLWASPNLEAFSRIARSWGSDPFSDASTSDYLLTNLSMPTIARIVGMTAPHRYALLHWSCSWWLRSASHWRSTISAIGRPDAAGPGRRAPGVTVA
jgi:hypothetical protein